MRMLARVQTEPRQASASNDNGSSPDAKELSPEQEEKIIQRLRDIANAEKPDEPAQPEIDIEQLAEFVLERLRHDLRDGRERLGFLLEDSR